MGIKKIIFFAAILFSCFIPFLSQAAILNSDKATEINKNTNSLAVSADYDTNSSFEGVISNVIRVVLSIVGTVFLVLMFVAGNNWMQAAGSEEKVKKAKETIRDLIIGLCFILAAYALSSTLGSLFTNLLTSK